jgi:hypothetical protein
MGSPAAFKASIWSLQACRSNKGNGGRFSLEHLEDYSVYHGNTQQLPTTNTSSHTSAAVLCWCP